jgi:hypothetical protein
LLNGIAGPLYERATALGLQRIMDQVIKPGAPPSRRKVEGAHETRDHRTGS